PNGAPLCDQCPAKEFCAALLTDRIGDLPVKTKKPPRRVEEREVYLIFDGPRVALRRRAEKGLLARLWEYPNALLGSPPPMALTGKEFAATGGHIFTHIEWRMTAYFGHPAEPLPQGWVWADKAQLRDQYAVPNAFGSFTHLVEERLGK
ncbi:MAG: NUDIX domain-containing protein, partial [Pseudoflavonifractor sp.]